MRILHYQCTSGLSGDMNLGAMIDLGVDPESLQQELRKLGVEGWSLEFVDDERSGITGTRCTVVLESEQLAGGNSSGDEGDHGHGHHHPPHDHGHGHHHHDHSHGRTYKEIRELIEQSSLSARAKRDALAVFQVLAVAEGDVHGKDPEDVHFHEVGAVDSIIDMVGAAICWDLLGIDAVTYSVLELGGGHVHCAHGTMPVPAPATARLVEGMRVSLGGTNKEATTPTGAALLKGMGARFAKGTQGAVINVGTGIGQRIDPNLPNAVQVMLVASDSPGDMERDEVWEIAVNLDDMSPEKIAFLTDKLMDAGALDVWQTPVTFKKGRSGVVVSSMVPASLREAARDLIFKHSTTLGLRERKWDRQKLERTIEEVETEYGSVRIKVARSNGTVVRIKPEFDDCQRCAENHQVTLETIESAAQAAYITHTNG